MPRRLLASLAAAAFALPAAAQQPDLRPGLWAFTMTGMANVKSSVCLTPAMVKDMKQLAAKGGAGTDCKSTNETASGTTRSFDVTCTKPSPYKAHVVVGIDGPDRFSMSQDYTMEHGGRKQAGKMAMTYRRIGECK